jgi:hypothetical protein
LSAVSHFKGAPCSPCSRLNNEEHIFETKLHSFLMSDSINCRIHELQRVQSWEPSTATADSPKVPTQERELRRSSISSDAQHVASQDKIARRHSAGADRALAAVERAQKAAKDAADAVAACSSDRFKSQITDKSVPEIQQPYPSPLRRSISVPALEPQPDDSPPRLTESALLQHTMQSTPFSLMERVIPGMTSPIRRQSSSAA